MTKRTHNLPELLELADAAYRATYATNAADGAGGQAAPDHGLSAFIRLSLDDLHAAGALQRASARLAVGWPADVTATTILDETMALTGAGLGNVQVAEPAADEPATKRLRIIAHAGFGREFIDHFEVVDDATSACGRAAAHQAQTVITDVETDEDFAPHRGVAAASKFRSVQSTPLIDADGELVGAVSTHFEHPGSPADRALAVTRLYGLVAGEALARSLAGQAAYGARAQHGQDLGHGPVWPAPAPTLPRATVLELTDTVVRALLSAGLSLASAQNLIDDGSATDRIAAAIDELDHVLGGIRSAVLELHV